MRRDAMSREHGPKAVITLICAAFATMIVLWVLSARTFFCVLLWVFVLSHNVFMNELFYALFDSIGDTKPIKTFLFTQLKPAITSIITLFSKLVAFYHIFTCHRSSKCTYDDDLNGDLVDESSEIEHKLRVSQVRDHRLKMSATKQQQDDVVAASFDSDSEYELLNF